LWFLFFICRLNCFNKNIQNISILKLVQLLIKKKIKILKNKRLEQSLEN